jgi:signal transduction histidine kinase
VFIKEHTVSKWVGARVPRNASLCTLATWNSEPVIFGTREEILKSGTKHFYLDELNIEFYAGARIVSKGGFCLGVISIADERPRSFGDKDTQILQNLAQLVADELELRLFAITELKSLNIKFSQQQSELTQTQDELLRSNQELDNFLYRASHDLKGPLSTLTGLLHLAQQELTDTLSLSYVHKLNIVSGNMNAALNKLVLIYTLLRERQDDPVRVRIDRISIEKMLNSIIQEMQREIDRKDIHINVKIEEGLQWNCHPRFLQLILHNLIENSVHFQRTNLGRKPIIRVELLRANGLVKITVYDNGEGISTSYRDRIFELFFRGSSSARSGMGLYIVKNLVEKLQGRIEVDSVFGEYSKFNITLPS